MRRTGTNYNPKMVWGPESLKVLLPMAGNQLRRDGAQVHAEIRGVPVVVTRIGGKLVAIEECGQRAVSR